MADVPDDLEKLLLDVRKTIFDNKLFLEKLVDETVECTVMDETDVATGEDGFEEL
jgi:hypothetical protein